MTLPFSEIAFLDDGHALEFVASDSTWKCQLAGYTCKKTGPAPQGFQFRRRPPDADEDDPPAEFGNDVSDGMVYLSPQQGQVRNRAGARAPVVPEGPEVKASPDGHWEAIIENYNVFLRPTGKKAAGLPHQQILKGRRRLAEE